MHSLSIRHTILTTVHQILVCALPAASKRWYTSGKIVMKFDDDEFLQPPSILIVARPGLPQVHDDCSLSAYRVIPSGPFAACTIYTHHKFRPSQKATTYTITTCRSSYPFRCTTIRYPANSMNKWVYSTNNVAYGQWRELPGHVELERYFQFAFSMLPIVNDHPPPKLLL